MITNPSGYLHAHTRKVLLPHIIHYKHYPTYSRCVIRYFRHSGLYHMNIHWAILSRLSTSRISHRVAWATCGFQAAPQASPAHISHVMSWQPDHAISQGGPECRTDTTVYAGNLIYIQCHTCTFFIWFSYFAAKRIFPMMSWCQLNWQGCIICSFI